MPAKKTKKKQQPVVEPEKDISRYTLPSPEKNTTDEPKNITVSPSETQIPTDNGGFWRARMGKIWLLFFLVLLIIAFIAGIYIFKGSAAKYGLNNQAASNPSPTIISPTATINPSPTTKPIDKSSVTIQVLNGSGIRGQAGKISQSLGSNGYTSVKIGNASEVASVSSLLYDKSLSNTVIDDITSVLKNDLGDLATKEATQTGSFDIIITTGKTSQ